MRTERECSALSGGGGAAEGIDVPELDVLGEVFYADLALHVGAELAEPDYAELGLGALILDVQDVAGLELSAYALERRSAAADGAQAGGFGKGAGVGVHSPDFDRKLNENALLAAAIHG